MPYTALTVTNGVTAANSTWGNFIQTQYTEASLSLGPDMATVGFVLSGLACVKDSSTATKLDITAGTGYVLQTDGTLRQRKVAATNETTSTPSTTYYLDLNPDGTLSWGTSHSGVSNYAPICQVTTDGSGNISAVTDKRNLAPVMYPGMTGVGGTLYFPTALGQQQVQNDQYAGGVIGGVTFRQVAAVGDDATAASASFNGTTGYINLPTTGLPTGNGAWSWVALMQFGSNPAANACIAALGAAATHQSACMYIDTSGVFHAGTFSGDTTGGAALSLNTWHLVVGTWDGTTIKAFVDGSAYGTNSTPGNMTIPANAAAQALIGAQITPQQWFPGKIAEVAIWGSALSPANIASLNGAISNGTFAATLLALSPLRYYRLNDAASSTFVVDSLATTVSASLVDAGGGLATVPAVNGQPSAGALGVPVVVATAVEVAVASTAQATIITYTPTVQGVYRVSGVVEYNGSGGSAVLQLVLNYTSPFIGATNYPLAGLPFSGSATPELFASGGFSWAAGKAYPVLAATIIAAAGSALTVKYTSPNATPNDHVTIVIERLT